MERLLEQIAQNLDKEKRIYQELLKLSEKKKDIILESRVKDLDKMVQLEQEYIIGIGMLEQEREGWIQELAVKQHTNVQDITLSTLISWSFGEVKNQLTSLQEEISSIVEKQKRLNHVNEKLIKTNLEYVDFAMRLMTGDDGSSSIYEKQGQVSQGNQNRNLFDRKA